jgi:hypothetical protein
MVGTANQIRNAMNVSLDSSTASVIPQPAAALNNTIEGIKVLSLIFMLCQTWIIKELL